MIFEEDDNSGTVSFCTASTTSFVHLAHFVVVVLGFLELFHRRAHVVDVFGRVPSSLYYADSLGAFGDDMVGGSSLLLSSSTPASSTVDCLFKVPFSGASLRRVHSLSPTLLPSVSNPRKTSVYNYVCMSRMPLLIRLLFSLVSWLRPRDAVFATSSSSPPPPSS